MSCCGSCGGQNPEQSNEAAGSEDNVQKPEVVTSPDEKQDKQEEN